MSSESNRTTSRRAPESGSHSSSNAETRALTASPSHDDEAERGESSPSEEKRNPETEGHSPISTVQKIEDRVRQRLFEQPIAAQRIGRFIVLEEIGRGGMGTVYATYDEQLDRKVAVKVLRDDDWSSKSARLRFQREAQAMARLSHANVVTVHEVGESEGVVYLAMEFIEGLTLASWLSTRPPWRDVVEAFVQAGRGLAAAHEAGLIHRDLKPHNIMRDVHGAVRVLDFGLARAIDEGDDSTTGHQDISTSGSSAVLGSSVTRTGTAMGTPAYMSPEQHQGDPIDARSDQYSFCVALWEGLIGERPFVADDVPTLQRAKLGGPPPWPSKAPGLPRAVVEAVRRGLAVDPETRWPSMNALLDVLERDPRRRRGRWMLGLAGFGALGLCGAAAWAWAQERAQRCEGARARLDGVWDDERRATAQAAFVAVDQPYAEPIWQRTEQQVSAYADEWVAMRTEACEATTIRGEQSERMMDLTMRCLDRAALELSATVDTLEEAEDDVVKRAHQLTGGLRPLWRCRDLESLEAEVDPPSPEEAEPVEQARTHLARSKSLRKSGRYEAAQASVQAARDALTEVEYGPVYTELAYEQGFVLGELGQFAESEAALIDALERAATWGQRALEADTARKLMHVLGVEQRRPEEGLQYWPLARSLSTGDAVGLASARVRHASILRLQSKPEEAESEYRAALELLDPEHSLVAMSRNGLAIALHEQGKYDEAEQQFRSALESRRRTLGDDHPHVAMARNNLAVVLFSRGKYDEAAAENRAIRELRRKTLGDDHPHVATSSNNLANALAAQGKLEEAAVEHRAALTLRAKALGEEHPDTAESHLHLGSILHRQGRHDEARTQIEAALATWTGTLPPDHSTVLEARIALASVLHARDELAEAERELQAVRELLQAMQGPAPARAKLEELLADALEAQGRREQAEVARRSVLELRLETLGDEHPDTAKARSALAQTLLELGRTDDALPLAEDAWTRRRRDDRPAPERAETAFVLARILWLAPPPRRDVERSRSLAEDALRSYTEAGDDHRARAADVERWLDEHQAS